MSTRRPFRHGDARARLMRRAIRLEAITIAGMLSVIAVVGLTMGSSQAMKTAWIEDLLSLVPPIAFLLSAPVRRRDPSHRFPFGFHRAGHIAFLAASTALLMFGLFLLYESVMTLVKQEHATIGTTVILGHQLWAGWLMIAALVYSMIIPVTLGRLKLPLAHQLHEKVLYTDAQMNKDDWLTAGAAILGILGIGMGWWWADALASGVISLEVTTDGARNLKRVVFDLMDARPTTPEGQPETALESRILAAVRDLPWVTDAEGRFREEGSLVTGIVFAVPIDEQHPIARMRLATAAAEQADWRCHDIHVILVSSQDLHHSHRADAED